ncbi:MAG TPA: DUF72 domain-containing protein [Desulfatirhabdiaceae bacterium]|nr:DUF72 domain-containing protein [Desulfatirhabdiaceae bacterium]
MGTSGYSYAEWVTAGFYSPGTQPGKMLGAYAQHFSVTELNFTWYQMPRADSLQRMQQQVSSDFRFTAKLNRSLTHEVDSDQWRSQANQYRDGISPLMQSGQLLAVLIQLPNKFDRSAANRKYLAGLLDELAGLPLAIEFRHESWATDRVFTELENRRITLVCVDTPKISGLFPGVDVVTNPDLFYVRFHGRNVRGWRSGNMQHQFDYDYSTDELQDWVDNRLNSLISQAGNGVMFFNNHVRAQAPRNAVSLIQLLRQQG